MSCSPRTRMSLSWKRWACFSRRLMYSWRLPGVSISSLRALLICRNCFSMSMPRKRRLRRLAAMPVVLLPVKVGKVCMRKYLFYVKEPSLSFQLFRLQEHCPSRMLSECRTHLLYDYPGTC